MSLLFRHLRKGQRRDENMQDISYDSPCLLELDPDGIGDSKD